MTHRHRGGFAAPYYTRRSLLIVLDGGRGKTTQLDRLRQAQTTSPPLFGDNPCFVEVPEAHREAIEAAVGRACRALDAGRTVFAERWDYTVRTPDLLLLLPNTSGSAEMPVLSAERIVPITPGHEGEVALAIWTAMAARGLFSPCTCIKQAAA